MIKIELNKWHLAMKLFVVCGLFLACSFSAMAQEEYSKLDIFGGYTYVRFQFPAHGFNANGGSAQMTYNVSNVFGLTGDFGGYHVAKTANLGGSGTIFTYLFGPKLTYREGKWSPFIQTLFGGAWLGAGIEGVGSSSASAFSMALGGGVDYKATSHISLRLFDADYFMTKFNAKVVGGTNGTQSNVRLSTGVVFNF